MNLNLQRPIIFFDIEATGLNVSKDRIVELCYIKISPDGKEESQTLRFNPQIPISEEATKVNGIRNEDVADCPTFKEKAEELAKIFQPCDIAGFNSNNYDVPLLVEEFARSGVKFNIHECRLVDVQTIYHKMEQRNLTAAYKYYCGKDLTNAHTALADTQATYEILKAQLEKYGEALQNNVEWLSDFSRHNKNIDLAGRFIQNDDGIPIINFGKHKGKPVFQVLREEPGYYNWIMQSDFTQDTKQVLLRLKLNAGL